MQLARITVNPNQLGGVPRAFAAYASQEVATIVSMFAEGISHDDILRARS